MMTVRFAIRGFAFAAVGIALFACKRETPAEHDGALQVEFRDGTATNADLTPFQIDDMVFDDSAESNVKYEVGGCNSTFASDCSGPPRVIITFTKNLRPGVSRAVRISIPTDENRSLSEGEPVNAAVDYFDAAGRFGAKKLAGAFQGGGKLLIERVTDERVEVRFDNLLMAPATGHGDPRGTFVMSGKGWARRR